VSCGRGTGDTSVSPTGCRERLLALRSGGRNRGFNREIEFDGDRGVEIHPRLLRNERDQQPVPDRKIDAILTLGVLPPASYGVDRQNAAIGQLGAGSFPEVLMK
jgi:hypothetical protein